MSREILFRAKRIDNREWAEGHLIQTLYLGNMRSWISDINDKIRLRMASTHYTNWRAIEVVTYTVCQYTGKTDKNGKKIWENDIVKQFADCNETGESLYYFYIIRWNEEYCAFEAADIYSKESYLFTDLQDIEVIGNIFDNPELIGEKL